MFEVWDKRNDQGKDTKQVEGGTFLGLGIVSIDELQIASNSRHVIPLQGRPYYQESNGEDDESYINGLLTVEFTLIEKCLSPNKSKSPTGKPNKYSTSSPGKSNSKKGQAMISCLKDLI